MVKTTIKGMTPNLQWLNDILALFQVEQIKVPKEYRTQVTEVKKLLDTNDTSGLANTLLDFAISSALVDYRIESDNENLNEVLNKWLTNINSEHRGKVPTGLEALAKEYFRERWKGSSNLLLRTFWGKNGNKGLNLPNVLFFVDGEDVRIKFDKNEPVTLGDEEYALRINKNEADDIPLPRLKNEKLFVQKPYESWGHRYPTPFIIRRGLFRNLKMLNLIEGKAEHIVGRALEYLMVVKKGTEQMALSGRAELTYDENDLKALSDDLKKFLMKLKNEGGLPHYTTNFDTEIEHMIPEYKKILEGALYTPVEKRVLAGLGLVDIVEGTGSTRRESILNPKPFMEEVRQGVKDFVTLLTDIIHEIVEENDTRHRKWMNAKIRVLYSPIKPFMNDKFRQMLRSVYDRGGLSKRTFVEVVGEADYDYEVQQRKAEKERGEDETMFAPVIQNIEGTQEPTGKQPTGDRNVPGDKTGIERRNFNQNAVVASCYECDEEFDLELADFEDEDFMECPECGKELEISQLIESSRIIGEPVDPRRDQSTHHTPEKRKKKKSKGQNIEQGKIVKRKDGWHVVSKDGKNLGGPYKTRKEAVERLRQVEFHK